MHDPIGLRTERECATAGNLAYGKPRGKAVRRLLQLNAMLARLPPGLAARDQGTGVFAWELAG